MQSVTKVAVALATAAAVVSGLGAPALAKGGDVCWKFTRPADSDPFPGDRIVINQLRGNSQHALTGYWQHELPAIPDEDPLVEPIEARPGFIPLHGVLQEDMDGFLNLVLDGTVVDTDLSAPFILECHVHAKLSPDTFGSVNNANDGVDDAEGHVYAYCRSPDGTEDAFGPDDPATDLLNLEEVDCGPQADKGKKPKKVKKPKKNES